MDVTFQNFHQLATSFPGAGIVKVYEKIRHWLNSNSKRQARKNISYHYDMGNDFYKLWLDKTMTYSSAFFETDQVSLQDAQTKKYSQMCDEIGVKEGDHILEIGCGWGGFAKFAAEKYGVTVHGVTVSKEQMNFAKKSCEGLKTSFELRDYRDLDAKYDAIVSIGMFEHVGYKNYKTFMNVANRCLTDDGLFLLHTIGRNTPGFSTDPWTNKYIFPNGMTPSSSQISEALQGFFVVEDWHNFGQDYDTTLMSWNENFQKNFDSLTGNYDERFKRMWEYYLLMCAGTFRSRRNQLWQLVMSKNGVKGGYNYKNNPRFNN